MTLFALILSPLMILWFLSDGFQYLLLEVDYKWFYCWHSFDGFSPVEYDSFDGANHPFHAVVFQSTGN